MFPELGFTPDNLWMTSGLGGLAAVTAAGVAALVLTPAVAARVLPKPVETRLADFLPFERLEADGETIVCRNGTRCKLLYLTGVDQNFLRDDDAISLFTARKNMLDGLMDLDVNLRIFTFRDPVDMSDDTPFDNALARRVAKNWNQPFKRSYTTRMVVMVSGREGKNAHRVDDAVNIILSTMDAYQPAVLTQNPETSPSQDMTIGKFLGQLVSPLSRPSPEGFGDALSDALTADEVEFMKDGRIRFRSGDDVKWCSVIGLRRLGDNTNSLVSNELSAINAECIIVQTVDPQPKTKTLLLLKQQQKMMSSTSFSPEVYNQYQAAIEMVEGLDESKSALCHFSETIFLFSDSIESLRESEKACRQVLMNAGMTCVIEKGATQASWFMQFPTYDVRPRTYRLMSANIAHLATFDRTPTGLPRSDWGPGPVARFFTAANSVYNHQFHVSMGRDAVGHGICIAPTGVGKTTLIEFLSCMVSRHKNVRHFFFDRFKGTYIYTSAFGGKYLSFNAEKLPLTIKGGMNPFQCESSEENQEFLKVWLQAITNCDDPDSVEQIARAVELSFLSLDKEERSLKEIYEASFTPGSQLRRELGKWVDDSQYGAMFNAEEDCIDLSDNRMTTFDMTTLLNDPLLGAASVSYIMHRIRQTLRENRSPGLIFIDETEPLLRDENFRKIYFVMLQEFRKLGGVVISAFQRPEALKATGTSELIRQQSGAYYLFPNPGANREDYDEFDLTERELAFILGQSSTSRRITRGLLIKKPMAKESVIVDIDLSPLGPLLKIFSSSSKDVGLASDLQEQFGDAWVERYLDHEAP